MIIVSEEDETQTNKPKKCILYKLSSQSHKPAFFSDNPLQMCVFFPPSCVYFLFCLTAGGFVCDWVKKQVSARSECALSDPIDLIQQGRNVEI